MPAEHIGRIGYVMDGLGDGKTAVGGGKEIRCNRCRAWFAEAPECPLCGQPRTGFNKHIRTNQLNRNLFEYAGVAAAQPTGEGFTSSDVIPPKDW